MKLINGKKQMTEEVVISKLDMAKMYILAGEMAATGNDPAKAEAGFRDAQVLLEEIDTGLSNSKTLPEFYRAYHFLTEEKYLTSREKLVEDTIRFMTICRVLGEAYHEIEQYSDGITVGLEAVCKIQNLLEQPTSEQLTSEQERELGSLHRMIGINYQELQDSEKALEHFYICHEIRQKIRKQKPNQKNAEELVAILLNLLSLEEGQEQRYNLFKEARPIFYKMEGKTRNGKYKAFAQGCELGMKKIDPIRAKEDCKWSWLQLVRLALIKITLGKS